MNTVKKDKLIVIDGNSLINRAFYALPLLTTKQGVFTNAVYGFVSMLHRLVEDENPDYLAVAFDKSAPTFRHKVYKEYKGHREKSPEEMKAQIPLLKQVLEAMKIYFIDKEGYEADDLLGTLCKRTEDLDLETLIVTGDKDLLQLINPNTKVLLTRKGISQQELFDEQEVENTLGIKVSQVIDFKALTGDKSDNIPGVPGVGKKTAEKLLKEYDTLEGILENISDISGKKIAERLATYKEDAKRSKKLVTIVKDVPITLELEKMAGFNLKTQESIKLLTELEMKTLVKRIGIEENQSALDEPETGYEGLGDYFIVENSDDVSKLRTAIEKNNSIGVYFKKPDKSSKNSAVNQEGLFFGVWR